MQPYFTHSRNPLTEPGEINAIYANLQSSHGKKLADAFWKKAKSKKDEGSLRDWLDDNEIKTAVKDLLVVAEDPFFSDVGSDTETEMMDAETLVSSLKKGEDKQEARTKQLLDTAKHVHSSKALFLATKIAVGNSTSQTTSALLRSDSDTQYFQMTSSSAPIKQWLETKHSHIDILEVGRNSIYTDGSHVHAEMRGLAALLRAGKVVKDVIVSKPICPVCYSVLAAFGCNIVDPVEQGPYFKQWGNPFKKATEQAWFKKADDAAQLHSENCAILKPL
jgi:hypothetical protein